MISATAADSLPPGGDTIGDAPRWVRVASAIIQRQPRGRYLAANRLSRRPTAPFWARLPRDLGGVCFRCDLTDTAELGTWPHLLCTLNR